MLDLKDDSFVLGEQDRYLFFRSAVNGSYGAGDLRVLSAYLEDALDQDSLLCAPVPSRAWLRVAVVMALRHLWPQDPESVRRVMRIVEADSDWLLPGCGDQLRNQLRFQTEKTFRVWRDHHPTELQEMLDAPVPAAGPCCPPAPEPSPFVDHNRQTQILIDYFDRHPEVRPSAAAAPAAGPCRPPSPAPTNDRPDPRTLPLISPTGTGSDTAICP